MISDFSLLSERLAALALFDVLDSPVEQAFDDITRFAAYALEVPIALISLVEEHRQWFKSEIGIGCRETPIGVSICAHAIRQDRLFEIPDLTLDPRFAGNTLVTAEPNVRFYAGAVLRTNDGIALGTVCALDRKPRTLTAAQREILLGLARQTMAQLELRRTLRQADVFRESQARFMAIAGHDLRQPLQLVSISIDIASLSADSPIVHKHLGVARDAVMRLGRGLDDLANAAARGSAITLPTERVPIRIDDLFSSFGATWSHQASAKGLRLDVVPCSASVISDQRLLSSIVGNLIGNAIKYTPSGRVLVGCRRRRSGLEICVFDTGIGISDSNLSQIFTPFKQINASSEGLGLGLTLVKQAADVLGCQVRVVSAEGRGSCFSVLIPSDHAVSKPG